MYGRINSAAADTRHVGQRSIRKFITSFEVPGLHGQQHTCIVHEALGMSLDELRGWIPGRCMKTQEIKFILREILN